MHNVFIIIVIIIVIICIFYYINVNSESLTLQKDCTSPIVTIPYVPLSCYDRTPGVVCPTSGEIGEVTTGNFSDMACACDDTTSCIGFRLNGTLINQYKSDASVSSKSDRDLYLRRSAQPFISYKYI
jgi:hypothetical protein